MPFDFAELNALPWSGRLDLFASDPQPLEEVLLYYLCPLCPAGRYGELGDVVTTIPNAGIRDKMWALMAGSSAIRRDGLGFAHAGAITKLVSTYKVKPPTDRLGGLYSDAKLHNVLSGMSNQTPLPPVVLRRTVGGNFKYEVVDGIHRYYASVRLGHGKLPALVQ